MKVLSLFDGMGCLALALQKAGIPIDSYDAYEIDEYAIKTVKHNFPFANECGDVFNADFTKYLGVDIIGGGFTLYLLEHSPKEQQRNYRKRFRLGVISAVCESCKRSAAEIFCI